LFEEVLGKLTKTGEFDSAVDAVVKGSLDPYSAYENLLSPALGGIPI